MPRGRYACRRHAGCARLSSRSRGRHSTPCIREALAAVRCDAGAGHPRRDHMALEGEMEYVYG
eukprot:scaffold16041_cov37-Phaeocystis_antarctica.AAC.3